jgi:hypothetical protein
MVVFAISVSFFYMSLSMKKTKFILQKQKNPKLAPKRAKWKYLGQKLLFPLNNITFSMIVMILLQILRNVNLLMQI